MNAPDSQILRLNLLDIARVTQRGVNYAIKAYTFKLGNLEFCTIVRDDTHETNVLHREITGLVRNLLAMELSGESDLRYILASERIANALRLVHSQAVEIAANSKENSWRKLPADADEETLASRETNPADSREVVSIPDGMEAFLESIDTCFADASFWSGL
jgi:hypothetical protein